MRGRCLLLAAFTACCAHAATLAELPIAGGAVPPQARRIVVTQGEHVQLRVTSDAPGELHLHAYRLSARVGPGGTAQLGFDANATGRFPLEWHPAARSDDAGHAAPLAWLEVHPR